MNYYERIKELSDNGDIEEAISLCRRWCDAEPENAKSFYNLGTLLHLDGNNSEAKEYLERCIELDPNHSRGLSNLGSVLCCKSKFKEATPYFQRALELAESKDKGAILARLADCYLNQGKYDKASPLISELYEIDQEMSLMLEGKMVREIIPGKKKSWFRR